MSQELLRETMREMENRMTGAIDSLNQDLSGIRTGRATPSLVDRLSVNYYGQPTPLLQIASVSVPDAQTLLIRPYAITDIPAIEKAIATSELGLTPSNDGKQVRLSFPPLTGERRRDLTKLVSKRAEEARVAVRNIRRDTIADIREMQKESMITEDDLHRAQDDVQNLTNSYIGKVDDTAKAKDEEILTL